MQAASAHRPYPAVGAPLAAPVSAAPPPPPPPPEAGVPDIVIDKKTDSSGNLVVRTYQRGRLLGKGGFARCFKFMNREKNRAVAGKVVDKETLNKARAKSKVRGVGRRGSPCCRHCAGAALRPTLPAPLTNRSYTSHNTRPAPHTTAAAGGDQDPPQREPQVHCGL